jgi:hypothetical protein
MHIVLFIYMHVRKNTCIFSYGGGTLSWNPNVNKMTGTYVYIGIHKHSYRCIYICA